MNIKTIHNVYFIGIGGIGMSALARYFKFVGKNVGGYDRVSTEITQGLEEAGIEVTFKDDVKKVSPEFLDPVNTLVVYTPAIPGDNVLYNYFVEKEFRISKRAEVLGQITESSFCYAVAGTHGKTTTSAILTHVLRETGTPLTAFLGGISENLNSNFLLEGDKITVTEADEFDRSFLHLSPDIACITSIDADHLDIYGDKAEMERTFHAFAKKVKPGGKLVVRYGLPLKGITYGMEEEADYAIESVKIESGSYLFDIRMREELVAGVRFDKPGKHNLLNALAAFAMAVEGGASPREAADALAGFKGVKRRFSYQLKTDALVYVDDYAHHPTEINAVYQAVREMYPGKKVLAVFQPHLFSRTRDFMDEFAESLSQFDEVVLLDIYPAREEPIEDVTSGRLLDKIDNKNKQLLSKKELLPLMETTDAGVVLTLGAGDIGMEVNKIREVLSQRS
ncbi:UDP-N-acetylmuramate--L-alanine ligase [Sinomicrobium weinanense]|uniref:UDP-N-acetylmuramate--L-alanine ligase n=1 Tax=Sinomicrobium weinanense TaxID=2842200 RepID=A0A926Q4J2_9FLAO|nr:UDP-N-acetylmuramate--L-alanine ligase [Sinomicrobium weinanense]MBC9797141.1 UDP-N-acetylmuramate--L-alanine ligase [Sinomicrobium weinanense]MBU3124842.1 UDP-N-acetylmuramate--L-alanine ligase [Sinomicrobium weinanense]